METESINVAILVAGVAVVAWAIAWFHVNVEREKTKRCMVKPKGNDDAQ